MKQKLLRFLKNAALFIAKMALVLFAFELIYCLVASRMEKTANASATAICKAFTPGHTYALDAAQLAADEKPEVTVSNGMTSYEYIFLAPMEFSLANCTVTVNGQGLVTTTHLDLASPS